MSTSPQFMLLALLGASVALGQPNDRAGALYSTQIRFNDRNVPVISIGIMDDQKRIQISTRGELVVLTEGLGGSEIVTEVGRKWTARVQGGVSAKTSWRVRVGGFEANDLEGIVETRRRWSTKGVSVRALELGGVLGFFGKVLDTRRVFLVTKATYPNRQAAEAAATVMAAKHEIETGVLPELERRPTGTIVLTDGRTTIRARDALWLRPKRKGHGLKVHQVEFGRGFGWHSREDRRFRGTLYLAVDRRGRLAVANMLSSETLLRGLVPAEIYPNAPPAALKAQAVSARGELLAKIGLRHLADPYLICSDVHCQVYAGMAREDERTTRAVQDTVGEMLFHDGQLVDTVYSASCGGHTEHNENVWDGKPESTLRGSPDGKAWLGEPTEAAVRRWVTSNPPAHCGDRRHGAKSFRWKRTVSIAQVRKGLLARGKDPGTVRSIKVTKRGVSGRALAIEVKGSGGVATLSGELVIRRALGGLKSSLFVVDTQGPDHAPLAFDLTGGGFGHGVGMCQTGAVGMGLDGKSFQEILKHYYKGVSVERIY